MRGCSETNVLHGNYNRYKKQCKTTGESEFSAMNHNIFI